MNTYERTKALVTEPLSSVQNVKTFSQLLTESFDRQMQQSKQAEERGQAELNGLVAKSQKRLVELVGQAPGNPAEFRQRADDSRMADRIREFATR